MRDVVALPDLPHLRVRHRPLHARAPRGVPRLLSGRRVSAQYPPVCRGSSSPSCCGDRGHGGEDREGGGARGPAARRRQSRAPAKPGVRAFRQVRKGAMGRRPSRSPSASTPPPLRGSARREGRAGSRLPHDDGTLTYAGLQALVNRTGNAFRSSLEREQRVLCSCSTRRSSGRLLGAHQIGAVRCRSIPCCAPGLSLLPERIAGPPSCGIRGPLSVVAPILGEARFLSSGGDGKPAARRSPSTSCGRARRRWRRGDVEGRRRLLALFLRSTGFPKGAVHSSTTWFVCCDTYALQYWA